MKVKDKDTYLKFLSGDFEEFHNLDVENKDIWLSALKSEFVNIQGKLNASEDKNSQLETSLAETNTKLASVEKDLTDAQNVIAEAKEGLDRLAALEADVAKQHRLSVIEKIKEQFSGKGLLLSEDLLKDYESKETNILELELSILEKLTVDPELLKSTPNPGIEEKNTTPTEENNGSKGNKFSREVLTSKLQNSLGKRR